VHAHVRPPPCAFALLRADHPHAVACTVRCVSPPPPRFATYSSYAGYLYTAGTLTALTPTPTPTPSSAATLADLLCLVV
jgi:hypothetical protein